MTLAARWVVWVAGSAAIGIACLFIGLESRPKPDVPARCADDTGSPSPEILRELAALKASVLNLRRELARAQARAGKGPPTAPASERRTESEEILRCALNPAHSCSSSPSDALLEHRARCGVVVYDLPEAFDDAKPDLSEWVDSVGLEPVEQEILGALNPIFHDFVREGFLDAYLELGGAAETAAELSNAELRSAFEQSLGDRSTEVKDRAATRQARVLTKELDPPRVGELSAVDYAAYLSAAGGHLYEDMLATELGRVRTRELHEAREGWGGERGIQGTPRCPESPE